MNASEDAAAALERYDAPHAEWEHPERSFEVARTLRLLIADNASQRLRQRVTEWNRVLRNHPKARAWRKRRSRLKVRRIAGSAR